MSKRYTGNLYGVDFEVIEDPNCPPNTIFFLNDKYMQFSSLLQENRWQRVKRFVKYFLKGILNSFRCRK